MNSSPTARVQSWSSQNVVSYDSNRLGTGASARQGGARSLHGPLAASKLTVQLGIPYGSERAYCLNSVVARDFNTFRGEQPPESSWLFAAPLEDRCRRNSRSQTEEGETNVLIFLATANRRTHNGTYHADTSQPDWCSANSL